MTPEEGELARNKEAIVKLLARGHSFFMVPRTLNLAVSTTRFAQWVRREVIGSAVAAGTVEIEACGADASIGEFELSVRSANVFYREGISRLEELVRLSPQDLLAFEGFGQVSLAEVEVALWRRGLALAPDEEEGRSVGPGGLESADTQGGTDGDGSGAPLGQEEDPSTSYVIVSARPTEIAEQVNAWMLRGYQIFGAPLVCGGLITQALIRADVRPAHLLAMGLCERLSGCPRTGRTHPDRSPAPLENAPRAPDANVLELPVAELELGARSLNCLRANDIRTILDLVRLTEAQLLGLQNLGKKSLAEIIAALSRLGLRAGMRPAAGLQAPQKPGSSSEAIQ